MLGRVSGGCGVGCGWAGGEGVGVGGCGCDVSGGCGGVSLGGLEDFQGVNQDVQPMVLLRFCLVFEWLMRVRWLVVRD